MYTQLEMQVALDKLNDENPDALLLEPREFFDAAICGVVQSQPDTDHWQRATTELIAVYDTSQCIQAICEWLDCGEDAAWEWYNANTSCAWLGSGTPTFTTEMEWRQIVDETPD